tara:strand:+ start:73 stop:219 length:147 start_codon:yes stop_codon:yes gene_type:complete
MIIRSTYFCAILNDFEQCVSEGVEAFFHALQALHWELEDKLRECNFPK